MKKANRRSSQESPTTSSDQACASYRLDPAGASFGVCVCGHSKDSHVEKEINHAAAALAKMKAKNEEKRAAKEAAKKAEADSKKAEAEAAAQAEREAYEAQNTTAE